MPEPFDFKPDPIKPLFDYRLCVLTDGRPHLREVLESFWLRVHPKPVEILMFDDGATQTEHLKMTPTEPLGIPFRKFASNERLGFCEATAALWQLAGLPGADWIFWLEDDFVFTEAIDLEQIAAVMDAEPSLTQMALYRDAVSDEERENGGYLRIPGRPYEPQETNGRYWLEHDLYWTTNPSLFRREIAASNPWPLVDECEGHFAFMLKDRALTNGSSGPKFGVWGAGHPQVRHVGVRSGHGY